MSAAPTSGFRGCLTALPTPFSEGRIDFAALHRLIRRQVEGGADALVLGGSTGESPALTRDERLALVEFGVGSAGGRVPIVAGLGSGDTRSACDLAEAATRRGAAGLLATTPAYSRPSARGLEAHFAAIAWSTELPLLLYNIPTRTGVDLEPETVARIAEAHDNVAAIKDSTSIERLRELVERLSIPVLCGDDHWIVDAMERGCAGVVAVVSNLVPASVARLVHALADGRDGPALAEAETVSAMATALALDTNPAPLNAACELMGLMDGELRLPLVPVAEPVRARIRAALDGAGLLPE